MVRASSGSVDGQQPHAEVGLADPAAGVDPRAERETEVAAARRLHQPRRLGERAHPDILPPRHDLEALRDEGAVEGLQPRDVRDGAERDEVEQVDELRLLAVCEEAAAAKLAHQRHAEQERHSDRREVTVRRAELAFVEPVGVDQREGDRKRRRALVMVDDDHVEAGVLRLLKRFERLRSAIDRDREARAALLELDQRRARRAIALHQPVGDVDHRLGAQPAQQEHEQGRAGRAVDVIIAENRDCLASLDRVGEPLRALVHVLEAGRVGQEVADRRLAVTLEVVATNSAGEQELVDQGIHRQSGLARPAPFPRLPAGRLLHPKRKRHDAKPSS